MPKDPGQDPVSLARHCGYRQAGNAAPPVLAKPAGEPIASRLVPRWHQIATAAP